MDRILIKPLNQKGLKSDWGILNYLFYTYSNFRPFLKVMNLTLDSWIPQRDPEVWKQDPDGLVSYWSEYNMGGEVEESLVQITRTPSNGDVAEKGESKTVR